MTTPHIHTWEPVEQDDRRSESKCACGALQERLLKKGQIITTTFEPNTGYREVMISTRCKHELHLCQDCARNARAAQERGDSIRNGEHIRDYYLCHKCCACTNPKDPEPIREDH
jgi:hypothetical protein